MNLTASVTVRVAAPLEMVFDLSQNWKVRHAWDMSVHSVEPIEGEERAYRVRGRMWLRYEVRYKLFRRPERTSLAMTAATWKLFKGGGGAWEYKADGEGTLWTQTNTVTLPDGLLGSVLAPFMWMGLRVGTKGAMNRFKRMIEREVKTPARIS